MFSDAAFEFVLVPRPGQTGKERRLQQTFARSHAARVSHPSKRRRKPASKHAHNSHPLEQARSPSSTGHDSPQLPLVHLSTPRNFIDDARSNPFDNNTLRNIPAVGSKSLEYVYTVLWPKNYPAVSGSALKSMQTTWRRRAMEDTLQFHAQVFNAVTMCYALSTAPSTMQTLMDIRLKHQTMAVNLVRQRLERLEGPVPEQLIADIMRLASQGGNIFRLSTTSPYPETPLANAFAMKPYGRFETSLPHFSALAQLVKQRGGLETLSVSVGHPIQLIDVGVAARLGTRPHFPIRRDFHAICDIGKAKFDEQAVGVLLQMGRGWQILLPDHPRLMKLALCAVRLTACLDQSHRRGAECLSLKDLGIASTIFQHDLYDMNPEAGAQHPVGDPAFNIARLGLQIYSDIVLFPAADQYCAKPRLCRELLETMRRYFDASAPRFDGIKVLVLWAAVMGAVASESPYHRSWYLRRMIGVVVQMNLDWQMLKTCMQQFLWWDHMFDARVRDAWDDAWKLVGNGESASATENESDKSQSWGSVVGGKGRLYPVMLANDTDWRSPLTG